MIVTPKSAVAPPARVALWRDEGGQNSAYGRLRRPLGSTTIRVSVELCTLIA
jgi:hypothetical protein